MSSALARRVAIWLVLTFSLAPLPWASAASTPVPELPLAPLPAMCQQAPIAPERLLEIESTPVPVPDDPLQGRDFTGSPADDSVVAGVRTTLIELFACLNAGEPLRAYPLYSDAYLRLIGSRQGGFSEIAVASLATPVPLDADRWTVVLDIADVRVLDDGRVATTVRLEPALVPVEKIFTFILTLENDRWLVDGVLDEITFSIP
jgi:hypothetical protein